jgi:uncharacterized protein YlxP (DUF503 family)
MVVGILQFELLIHGAESLKDKRRVISSVRDRLHREFQVSVAEVASQEMLNVAVMGLAAVGNEGGHLGRVLDTIVAKLRALGDAELGLTTRRMIHGHAPDPTDDELDDAMIGSLAAEMLARAAEVTGASSGEGEALR